MSTFYIPSVFQQLSDAEFIKKTDILQTDDGFYFVNKSISDILAQRSIFDFPDSSGRLLACNRFFDDWFLYATPNASNYVYSLLKLREQEHDAEDSSPADGDMPGVTISFISFHYEILLNCLNDPSYKNRQELNNEINRVVAHKSQKHHSALKQYFVKPESSGSYLVADLYTKYIASLSSNGYIYVPAHYKQLVQKSLTQSKFSRLPRFIDFLNQKAGRVICDNTKIYIKDFENLDIYEAAAILATHTGNTSAYSFAAEVEYHARFLTPLFKVKIPLIGKSIYASAIRADMTVGDTEFEGPAPFHHSNSRIVKRQYQYHKSPKLYF